MMASYYTRSKAPRLSDCSNVEPSDVAPVAATSPSSIIVRPSVAAAGGSESVSTESAGPVSAPLTLSQREAFPPRADSVCQGLWVLLKWGLCLGVPQRSDRPA